MDRFLVGPEFALSTLILLLTFRGWELHLGERAFRCVTGDIRIPFHPPPWRFWPTNAHIVEVPVEDEDDQRLSDGPSTLNVFRS